VPYTALYCKIVGRSLSPVVDDSSFGLVYNTPAPSPLLGDVTNFASMLSTRLTTVLTGQANALTAYWGSVISRASNSAYIQIYDISSHLTGTPHGAPVYTLPFTPAGAYLSATGPEGVCVVTTLQASYGSDVEFAPGARPRARDRGRFYFGPVGSSIFTTEATTHRTIVQTALATEFTKFVQGAYQITTTGSVVYTLGVWSRKNGAIKPPIECWVDDRPDYQRRRADQGATKTIQGLP